ncbi:TPA: 5-aminolevulinate synthase [Salmonella enterica]
MYNKLFIKNLENLKKSGQYRTFITLSRICGKYPLAKLDKTDKEVTVWCSNDYLGMSQNPVVCRAIHDAIEAHGAGSGGSRNIGGTHHFYPELEESIANWHGKEAALVFPTGFSSNDATLQCLLRLLPDCVVISDEQNHASIINGIRAVVHSERKVFRHNDLVHLEEILASYPKETPKIIIFESVYSMDGDVSPVNKIVELARRYNSLTYLDEVHAVGMYGPSGAGIAAELGVEKDVDIIQGTMAKAIGIIGGYIAGNSLLIDSIRSFSTGFIFTTSLPPSIVAGCLASIEYLKKSDRERNNLHIKTKKLREALKLKNIPVMPCSTTHVLPILIGDAIKCKMAADRLLSVHNIYLQPINSPSVAIGSERFRINATPNHTDEHINNLADSLREVFDHFSIPDLTEGKDK